MKNCKDHVQAFSRGMDQKLPFWTAFNLRLHRLLCRNCGRFCAQWEGLESGLNELLEDPGADASPELGGTLPMPKASRSRIGRKLKENGL